ncbi:MAG: parvulin peptidyl-prolyl isomerase, partial [Isosphaeraceae bacterium]|nr:parvulin peptidyl-prolyl isomerase [Isosphaeraceae bacterium]
MSAKDRGRRIGQIVVALAAVGAGGTMALGQQAAKTPASQPKQQTVLGPGYKSPPTPDGVSIEIKRIPANPGDPVAIVNGEVITRGQLADECVSRKGEEILDTLIARKLIDQAMKARKIEVTAAEVDAEIDRVAQSMAGLPRDAWLRTLAKERGISPVQYARDIIYPSIALRKLAEPRVQVTAEDIKEAYEAQFGEKLRCRLIMTDRLDKAKQLWEELRKNPGNFEKIAMNDPRSMDQATRAVGGMLPEPIVRHAYPRPVTDAAFAQLVDVDPEILKAAPQDPAAREKYLAQHAPKDGAITGPIQVTTNSWIILKREGLIPAQKYDPNDQKLREQLTEAIREAKVKDEMTKVFENLMQAAKIENRLTGQTNT